MIEVEKRIITGKRETIEVKFNQEEHELRLGLKCSSQKVYSISITTSEAKELIEVLQESVDKAEFKYEKDENCRIEKNKTRKK